MIRCIICYQKFTENITLKTLFTPTIYCESCLEKLDRVKNNCPYCSHPLGYNCCDKSIINVSIYFENSHLKDILYHIKYYNLYEKLFLFKNDIEAAGENFKDYCAIPVPLSSIMSNKRGFNQSYFIASFTKLKIHNCIERLDNITQSQKTYYERINTPPKFKLNYLPKNKNVLLVDDIYTTGSTLKSIIALFPEDYNIKCLTLQRTILK